MCNLGGDVLKLLLIRLLGAEGFFVFYKTEGILVIYSSNLLCESTHTNASVADIQFLKDLEI